MDWIIWINTMVPLTYSAGPGNVLVAVSGVRVGMIKSLPFILGLDLTYLLLSIIVGIGIGNILISHPTIVQVLKYLGVIYIFYLGSLFFINSSQEEEKRINKNFQIVDGIVVQLTNVKGMIMLIVMFSEFSTPNKDNIEHVLVMSIALASLNFSAHLLWASLGSSIQKLLGKHTLFQQSYNYIFGSMLIVVSIWLMIRF